MVEIAGLALAVCFLVAAAYWYYWHSPTPVLPPLGADIRERTIRVGNKDRSYRAYIPAHLPPQAGLVIVLHGSGMDGTRMRVCRGYEFDRLADQHGFVVLYPDGYRRNWNDCRKDATFPAKRENMDDVSFVRALIAHMIVKHAINDRQVYVFGYSNGGHMSFRLAIELPTEIAAVAVVAASLPTLESSSCSPEGPTSRIMVVNGTSDPINPYLGGIVTIFGFPSRGSVMSSVASAQSFAERNGITTQPVSNQLQTRNSNDPTSIETLTWEENGRPYCYHWSVRGGGHVIPQQAYRFPRLLGRTTSAMNAPREAIHFFGLDEGGATDPGVPEVLPST
jgi:polyhydroxybutyrate depolymerase